MLPRENPFRSERLESLRYRPTGGGDVATVAARLGGMGWRGAIVGPEGTGKTTLVEQLVPHVEGAGLRVIRVTVTRDREGAGFRDVWRAARGLGGRDVLVFDGAEQLAWWQWSLVRWATRRGAGLVITSHRPGLLPTVAETRSSPELLKALIEELLGMEFVIPVDELFARHGGNLRACLRECYDRRAGLNGDHGGQCGWMLRPR